MTRREYRPDAGLNFVLGDREPNDRGAVVVSALTQELVPHSIVRMLTSVGSNVFIDFSMEATHWRRRRYWRTFLSPPRTSLQG
jgi:hypothetical protein